MFNDHAEALAAARADYAKRPATARDCQLGDLMIVRPPGLSPAPGLLWVMGFNGGETAAKKDANGDTPGANRWFRLCTDAADAIGAAGCIIGERTHWGSPNVPTLRARVGSPERFRELLAFHARVNRTLLRDYRPSVVWLTGLSAYIREAEHDYGLTPLDGQTAPRDKRGRLWQEYRDTSGLPWLATIHPTGARMSGAEFGRVKDKLAAMALAASRNN